MEILNNEKSVLVRMFLVFMVIVSLYFVVKIVSEIKSYNNIGVGGALASNTITFSGSGEINAAPDLATITFTIRENAKEMKDAQTAVTTKETSVLDFLEKSGIAKKDIKTESYNSYPKYEYGKPCYEWMSTNCRQEVPKVIGYEVSEYVSVKVRDLAKAGEIVKGVGDLSISDISGPNFSIEKEEEFKAQARKMAIVEAKEKAEVLAKDLGVKLVRIVNFSENGNYPMPMYAKRTMAEDSVSSGSALSPELPTGESKITSNVSITYEIR